MSSGDTLLSDADIRPALRTMIMNEHAGHPDTAVVDELGLCRGRARVDLAVVNGSIHGYEIKSERDSLRRLELQVEIYGQVFDRATLVVADKHLPVAKKQVPDWWRILSVSSNAGRIEFQEIRNGCSNPSRNPRALVELLWLEDAVDFLSQRRSIRGLRGKPRRVVWDEICKFFDLDEIAAAVRSHIKARKANPALPQQ
jgi:hypothetical protein